MKDFIGIIAVVLAFVAYIPYFLDILKKKSIPHPYSWLIWGLTSFLIFGLQMAHGGGAGAYTTATVGFISLLVAILAFRNGAKQAITSQDTIIFIIAIIAALLWLLVDQPVISVSLLVGADILGIIPSIRKAWHKPHEETLSMWLINTGRHGISIFALQQYNFITLLNPLAWVVANGVFSLILIARRSMLKNKVQ